MKNEKKYIYVLLGIVFVIAVLGVYLSLAKNSGLSAGSTNAAVGTTYGSAKVAQVNMTPATAAATSTSILNTDSYDRIVTDTFYDCNTAGTSKVYLTGNGLASLIIRAATSTTAAQGANTNYVMYNNMATTSPDVFMASTTIAVGDFGRVWATGTYMNFSTNATNTAVCTVGVHYIGF